MGLQRYQALMTVNWCLSKRGERDGLYPPLIADTQYVYEAQDFSVSDSIDTLISNFQPSQL